MYKKLKIESSINNLRIVENAIDEVMNEIGITRKIMERFWFLHWRLLIMQLCMEINRNRIKL